MCTFTFLYTDGKQVKCEHVKSACYATGDKQHVSEDSLCSHIFLMNKQICLFSENGSFCIDNNGLRCIEVTKE